MTALVQPLGPLGLYTRLPRCLAVLPVPFGRGDGREPYFSDSYLSVSVRPLRGSGQITEIFVVSTCQPCLLCCRYDQKFSTCIMLQSAAPSNVDPHSSDYRYHYQHHRPEDDKEAEKLAGLSRRYPAQILPEAHQHPPRVVRDPILDVVTTPPMVNKAERSPQVAKAV